MVTCQGTVPGDVCAWSSRSVRRVRTGTMAGVVALGVLGPLLLRGRRRPGPDRVRSVSGGCSPRSRRTWGGPSTSRAWSSWSGRTTCRPTRPGRCRPTSPGCAACCPPASGSSPRRTATGWTRTARRSTSRRSRTTSPPRRPSTTRRPAGPSGERRWRCGGAARIRSSTIPRWSPRSRGSPPCAPRRPSSTRRPCSRSGRAGEAVAAAEALVAAEPLRRGRRRRR